MFPRVRAYVVSWLMLTARRCECKFPSEQRRAQEAAKKSRCYVQSARRRSGPSSEEEKEIIYLYIVLSS
jgi:hypothetical protein